MILSRMTFSGTYISGKVGRKSTSYSVNRLQFKGMLCMYCSLYWCLHGCFTSQLSTYNPLIKTLQEHFLSLLLKRKNKHQGIGAGARYGWHCSHCWTINLDFQSLKGFCCIFPRKLSVSLIQTTDGRGCLLVTKRAARKIFQRTTSLKSIFTLAKANNWLKNTSFSLAISAFQYSHGSVSGPVWLGL